jgi:hypothetical protein
MKPNATVLAWQAWRAARRLVRPGPGRLRGCGQA